MDNTSLPVFAELEKQPSAAGKQHDCLTLVVESHYRSHRHDLWLDGALFVMAMLLGAAFIELIGRKIRDRDSFSEVRKEIL